MQLIKRLQCLAFAAITLAFAQLPALAADPVVSTDPAEPRYSPDGGANWYKFTSYPDFLDNVIPGTADSQKYAYIENLDYKDIYEGFVGCATLDSYPAGRGFDVLKYTTIQFKNCKFSCEVNTGSKYLVFEGGYVQGVQYSFVDCEFHDVIVYCMHRYGVTDATALVDFSFEQCTFWGKDNVCGGGTWIGDVTIKNCTCYGTDRLVNVNSDSSGDTKVTIDGLTFENTIKPFTRLFIVSNGKEFLVKGLRGTVVHGYNAGYYKFKPDTDSLAVEKDNVTYIGEFPSDNPYVRNGEIWVSFYTPAKVTYDADGGEGTPPVDDGNYRYNDGSAKAKAVTGLSKGGVGCIGWATSSGATEPEYRPGDAIEVLGNVKLYAVYGEVPREPTGQYRISCIKSKATEKQKAIEGLVDDGTVDENGNAILYKDYPWYPDVNWMTNVYDTVKTVWVNGSSDDPLTVTVWGKETTLGGDREPLLLGDGDMTTDVVDDSSPFRKYHYLFDDADITFTTFVFDHCVWAESSIKTVDDGQGRYVIAAAKQGVDFVFDGGIMTNSVTTIRGSGTFNVGLTFDGVRFEKTCGYTQYFAANVDFRNCTFAAGYYNKLVQAQTDMSSSGGNSADNNGTAIATFTNNTWEEVSPGQVLFGCCNYDYAKFGDTTYGDDKPLSVDMLVYDKADDNWWLVLSSTSQSNDLTEVSYDQVGKTANRCYLRFVVHPVRITFKTDATTTKTTLYAVKGNSKLWTARGERADSGYDTPNATVDNFPDVSTTGNLWYEESDRTTGYTLEELKTKFAGTFEKDLTFIEGKPIAPELVGTLKMPSFVKGLDPTQPSGLFWRMGENGDLYPLALKDGEMPKYEYYIYTDAECKNHIELEGGNQATVDQLKLLEPGTYYVRGEVRDFKPYKYSGELLSAAAEFTVVDPDDYPDYMFVQWIEMTGCQCVNTKVNPSEYYKEGGIFEGEDYRKFGFWLDFEDYNPNPGNGGYGITIMGTGPWQSFGTYGNTPGLWFTDADKGTQGFGYFSYLYKTQGGYLNPCLRYNTRVQVQLTNQWYSISSPSDVEWIGTDIPNVTNVTETDPVEKVFGLPFVLSGRLISTEYDDGFGLPEGEDGGRWQDNPRRGYIVNNQIRHYSLRFYHDSEIVYDALPAIDKRTGRRGFLKIGGREGVGQEFVYSSNVADGTNTANKAMEAARSAMAGHLDGPLGIHELKTPLLNFEDLYGAEMFQNVRVLPGRVAETIEGLVADRLHEYPTSYPDMTSGYWVGSLDDAAYRVLYSTDEDAVFTNIVFDATNDVKKTDMAALAAWSPVPPADATEFKVAILTAVSKPVVREVTVTRGITVTLNANGGKYGDGEETAKLEAMPGEPMAELADVQIPTRVDEDGNEYTFIGYFDKSGEQYYDKDGKPTKDTYPETDIDLYAHWVNSEYDVIGYLQNWDPVKPDSRAGYVDLGENVHLSGDNLVGLKYCLETNDVAYQNIFMTRTKINNKYTEFGLCWSMRDKTNWIKFHYAKDVNDPYGFGLSTDDTLASATNTDLAVWLGGKYEDCLLNGNPYPDEDQKNLNFFEAEINNNILLFVADKGDVCDGVPEVTTDAAESNRINYCMIGKMYYFKVLDSTDNRELVLDLVPVTNKTTGVRGFYDTLTEAFYPLRMPIQLHYENGTGNSEYVYSVKGETLPKVMPPKYAGHVFLGYFDSEGTKYYDADGKGVLENPYTEAADLYARWKLACPLELFIAAHAHTADVDSKQYVYLAVQPSFATALTDAAFSTWLDEAKAGNAFKVCVSDDGETFSDAIEVTLDDSGAHKYDADKAKGWMWMKVDISAAKAADKKYWKAMFVTPEPAQPAPEVAD